jgi:hypothetical protein
VIVSACDLPRLSSAFVASHSSRGWRVFGQNGIGYGMAFDVAASAPGPRLGGLDAGAHQVGDLQDRVADDVVEGERLLALWRQPPQNPLKAVSGQSR